MDGPADAYLMGLMVLPALPIAWPCIGFSGLLRPTPGASAMGGGRGIVYGPDPRWGFRNRQQAVVLPCWGFRLV